MISETEVIIDSSSRIWYSSYYIEGLYSVFGKKNVSFSSKYFIDLEKKKNILSYDQYMALVLISPNNNIKKIIIDFCDPPTVNEKAYAWCDKYAKINFNLNLTDQKFHDKIISIPPGFAIKIWGIFETIYYCFSNLIKCKFSPIVSFKNYFFDYGRQYKQASLFEYIISVKPDISTKPFVFLIATLWTQANCVEGTNLLRKTFIEVCKTLECNFEGGFFAVTNDIQYKEYESLIFTKRYSINQYLSKTKISAFVFNTPTVHNCHGWKLGEYLAMGKAIISTPLANQLPEELKHGENIHIVTNVDELKNAIDFLLKDGSYRRILEEGARTYYYKYVDPKSVINNILEI